LAGLDEAPRTADRRADEHFSIELAFDDSLFVIELYGELDLAAAPEVERAIARAEETSAVTILVDLSGLEFIDSSGVRVLLTESKRSQAGTDRLRFLHGVGQVERTLELCGLDHRLPFVD
jgi:anti-sigma B factor antagonist